MIYYELSSGYMRRPPGILSGLVSFPVGGLVVGVLDSDVGEPPRATVVEHKLKSWQYVSPGVDTGVGLSDFTQLHLAPHLSRLMLAPPPNLALHPHPA